MSAGELSLRAAELVALNMYRFVFLWPFSAISQQNIFCVFFSDTSSSSTSGAATRAKSCEREVPHFGKLPFRCVRVPPSDMSLAA